MDRVELPEKVKKIFQNAKAIKAVSTIGEDGTPHTVFKSSMKLLDDGNIAFLEMIENSRTSKNILNLINIEYENMLPLISITILDAENYIAYEIKGKFNRFILEGPLWKAFLKETWNNFPDVDPVGVWLFEPVQFTNQSLYARIEEEGARLEPQGNFWFRYLGRDL